MANRDSEAEAQANADDKNISEKEEDDEIPNKFIDQALSLDFMHDPVKILKTSKFSYDRACLERLWDTSDQYNQCPYRTDGRFDIRDIIPNWNLRKKAEKWVSKHRNNSNIPPEGIISCYRKPIMDTEMRQRFNELNDLIRLNNSDDLATVEAVTKKLRRLRLECQHHYPNRSRLVKADGQTVLLKIIRWDSEKPPLIPNLRAEVLRMLIDIENYLDIPTFLRQNPLALVDIILNLFKLGDGFGQTLPRGLRFDSCHLLCLAIRDWNFESDEKIQKLLRWATVFLFHNFYGDESMKNILPILLHLSQKPSTLSAMSTLCGDLLMQKLNIRIEELSATIQAYEAHRNPNPEPNPTPAYLEMALRLLYNLVLDNEQGLLLFLDRNTDISRTIHRLVQLKVHFPHKFTDAHLHICLQILSTVYNHCAQAQMLSTYIHGMYLPLINIMNDASFSLDIRCLARDMLRHYLDLQSFLRNRITRQRSIFPWTNPLNPQQQISIPPPHIFDDITYNLHLFTLPPSGHHQNQSETMDDNNV